MNLTHFAAHYKVFVLAPFLETDDENLKYYYDFTQSIKEYERVFKKLRIEWEWSPVTLKKFEATINSIVEKSQKKQPLFFNLCDGDEVNECAGISVIRFLEEKKIIYTGANDYFFDVTTSKIPMKKLFDEKNIPTAAWFVINDRLTDFGVTDDGKKSPKSVSLSSEDFPLILKPAVSGGSMGISTKSVVHNFTELKEQFEVLKKGYHSWNLLVDGAFAEKFIAGREFTTMIVGNCTNRKKAIVYKPVERVFHKSLSKNEQFLSFDRLWEFYDNEKEIEDAYLYQYETPEKTLIKKIKKISWEAYASVGGTGYGRVDLRIDENTGKIYVLEVNAQCGISEDEDFTSIGAILRLSKHTYAGLVWSIIQTALNYELINL